MAKSKTARKVTVANTIKAHRSGWLGVWDAAVSAVTGKQRFSVPAEVVFSVVASGPVELRVQQLTEKESKS